MSEAGDHLPRAAARLARQEELIAVDALLGAHDWTARDRIAALVLWDSQLVGAATLTPYQSRAHSAQLRVQYRLMETLPDEPAAAAFEALVTFARDAAARAEVASLAIDDVAETDRATALLRERGFQPASRIVHFEGDIATARSTTRLAAERLAARHSSVDLVPLTDCSPMEVVALSALGIGAVGLGVRAFHAADWHALEPFAGSFGIQVAGRLRGAIVAELQADHVFLEMLVIERRFAPLGLAVLLAHRCASAHLASGATTYRFCTSSRNEAVLRFAQRMRCRKIRESRSWQTDLCEATDG